MMKYSTCNKYKVFKTNNYNEPSSVKEYSYGTTLQIIPRNFQTMYKRRSTDLEIQPQYTKWEAGREGYQRPAWQRRSLG